MPDMTLSTVLNSFQGANNDPELRKALQAQFSSANAFGLGRAIPRPYHKISIILRADGAGNWVPQQSATLPVVTFEHGVDDNFAGVANPFANAGISGIPATRSLEITNSPRNGGFSMEFQAIILGFGVFLERVRRVTIAAGTDIAATATEPARVRRSGGTVFDIDWQETDRLLINLLGGAEWQLLPVNNNTDCNLMLGVPQLMTARTGWENGPTSLGKNSPQSTWAFRDDVVVNPGVSGNNDQPNRLALYWLDGVLTGVQQIVDSTPAANTQLLVLDMVQVVDVAFGRLAAGGSFQFATPFDQAKYEQYRACV